MPGGKKLAHATTAGMEDKVSACSRYFAVPKISAFVACSATFLRLSVAPSPASQVSFLRLCDHLYAIADNSVVGFGRQYQHGQSEQQQQQQGGVAEESDGQKETINKALEEVKHAFP